jgi:Domain of unknown function (DUF4352)
MEKIMKKAFFIALGTLILAAAFLACGAASSNTGTLAGNGTTNTNAAPTQAPAKHFKPGDQVNVGANWQVTVNTAKTSQGDSFITPKSGNQYLLIDVSLKNISNKEEVASSLAQWALRDTTGQQYTETIVTDATAPDGKVEAGSPLRGVLAYEVPTSTKSFTLAFENDLLSSGQTIWDIAL